MRKRLSFWAIPLAMILAVVTVVSPLLAYATESSAETKHYLGSVVNAGHDTGFSKKNKITEKDPHFGWNLGSFYVDGYTRVTEDKNGDAVFLKTVGDTVTLWFELEQNIAKLNGNDMLSICGDTNGYDEYFGVKKTNMGRGTLIIRHTDYQNRVGEPIIYTDYLAANATKGAAVEVKLCEEGDYEVALDYEIRKDNVDIFGWNPFPSYYNYRIFFRFSVRNGNCMVYPFDVVTGAELTNSSITENGFYLDLAKSRYLNIDIKKEVRKEGAEGLTEDVRFNKPAKDGEKYTDEGIYTITVSNLYTNQTTTKVIYVGTDDVLKAHVATGLSITDVEYQLSMGATVAEDGTLIPAPEQTLPTVEPTKPVETIPQQESDNASSNENDESDNSTPADSEGVQLWPFVVGGVTLAAILFAVIVILRKRKAISTDDGIEDVHIGDNGGSEE
jgi:hypothetical protein